MPFTAIPAMTLPAGSSTEIVALHDAAEALRTAHNVLIGTGASALEKFTSEAGARKSIHTFLAAVGEASGVRATTKHREMSHKDMRNGFVIQGYPGPPKFHDRASAVSAEALEANRIAREQASNVQALFAIVEGLAEQIAELN